MIQVYTGNGKGKTTAAIGLSLRAAGAGKKVLFIQFLKAKGFSEHKIMAELAPRISLETVGRPFFIAPEGAINKEEKAKWMDHTVIFPPGSPPADYLEMIDRGLDMTTEALAGGEYDLVVLDEINIVLSFGLAAWPRLEEMLNNKAEKTEVVLTGRGACPELIEKADLVTEMKEIKHYYTEQGLEARPGIEN
jgi:cob(I)alamin adenosyltransferase